MSADNHRIVNAAGSVEEEAVDRAIRPKKLADYVGQEQVKAQLEIFVQAAVKRGSIATCRCPRARCGRTP